MRQYYASDRKKRENAKRQKREAKRLKRLAKNAAKTTQSESGNVVEASVDKSDVPS
jgi:hypothetical protein